MRSDCRALLSTISAYLDGDLAAAECAAIEQHCATCPDCTAVVGSLRETVGLCRNAGETPLPEPVRSRAQARIQEMLAGPPPDRAQR